MRVARSEPSGRDRIAPSEHLPGSIDPGRDTPGDGPTHAFVWTQAHGIQDIGTLGGSMSRAAAINNAGQVVGGSFIASGYERAFLWTATGGMRDLGHLGGFFSRATAINDAGEVVGMSSGPGGRSFGHGSPTLGGETAMHEYESWGTYTVALTVSDAGGLSNTRTTTVTIAPLGHLKVK